MPGLYYRTKNKIPSLRTKIKIIFISFKKNPVRYSMWFHFLWNQEIKGFSIFVWEALTPRSTPWWPYATLQLCPCPLPMRSSRSRVRPLRVSPFRPRSPQRSNHDNLSSKQDIIILIYSFCCCLVKSVHWKVVLLISSLSEPFLPRNVLPWFPFLVSSLITSHWEAFTLGALFVSWGLFRENRGSWREGDPHWE